MTLARNLTLAALLLVLAIGGDHLRGPNAPGVASWSRAAVEAALDFDLNEPPPLEDDELAIVGQVNDELAAADELDNDDPLRLLDEPDPSSPMEGLEVASGPARPSPSQSPPPPSRTASIWSRVKEKLPGYFDFGEFAQKFKRQYKETEAQLRRSIFVAKCVEIFKSRVAYRMGQTSYLRSVNKYSDQTRDEMALMSMPAPPPEFAIFTSTSTTANGEPSLAAAAAGTQRKYASELAERKRQLERPDAMDVDTQGMFGEDSETRARHELGEFFKEQEARTFSLEQEEAMARAFEEELRGVGVETMTRGIADGNGGGGHNLPWPGQLKSADAMDLDLDDDHHQDQQQDATKRLAATTRYEPPPVDRLVAAGLDWSQHECFHQVYDQGPRCGQCYVMATTALAEFYKCSEAGPQGPILKRKFSKHYVLSCAQKVAPTVVGCAGGSPLDTMRFISRAGIWNIPLWNDKRHKALRELRASGDLEMSDELTLNCPLDATQLPIEQWGPIQITMNPKLVHPNEWMEALNDGPLVATVQLPPEGVDSYAGGVHDGADCATSGLWHSMILVGYGLSERGEPYWRFRSSFGPDWGERGHFNLAMRVPSECLTGGVRVYREPLDSVQ